MTKTILHSLAISGLFAASFAGIAHSQSDNGTLIEGVDSNGELTTLAKVFRMSDIADQINGEGPFTVFAPTDGAFSKISAEDLDMLMENTDTTQLGDIISCHVVEGEVSAESLQGMIEDNGGTYEITTVGGCKIAATIEGGTMMFTDENGGQSMVTPAVYDASNGVLHVIDAVILPKP